MSIFALLLCLWVSSLSDAQKECTCYLSFLLQNIVYVVCLDRSCVYFHLDVFAWWSSMWVKLLPIELNLRLWMLKKFENHKNTHAKNDRMTKQYKLWHFSDISLLTLLFTRSCVWDTCTRIWFQILYRKLSTIDDLWNIFRRTWMFPNGMIFRPYFLGNLNRSKTFSKKVSKESIIGIIEKLESRQKDVQTFDPFFLDHFNLSFHAYFFEKKMDSERSEKVPKIHLMSIYFIETNFHCIKSQLALTPRIYRCHCIRFFF